MLNKEAAAVSKCDTGTLARGDQDRIAVAIQFLPRVRSCAARGKAIGLSVVCRLLSVVCQHKNRQISTFRRK